MALPTVASAQLLDPTLEQYAPSTQQIDKKVKGDGGDGQAGDDGKQGDDPEVQPGGNGGGVEQGGDGEVEQGGDGEGEQGSDGEGEQGSTGGEDREGNVGGGIPQGGDGGGTPSVAQSGGTDARVLGGLPFTWFDFVAFALATGALVGTAVVLRRLSRSPTVGG